MVEVRPRRNGGPWDSEPVSILDYEVLGVVVSMHADIRSIIYVEHYY